MPKQKVVVEIRAPHNGAVEDVNIYNLDSIIVEEIIKDIRGIASFVNEAKAEIGDFELTQIGESVSITLISGDYEKTYDLGEARVEVTYGGLAYNVFQNLYALNRSLEDRLSLRPVIGLPPDMIQKLMADGFYPEHDFLLSANPRKSLMMVCDSFQLNLVTKEATVFDEVSRLTTPDVAVVSSYPSNRNEEELDHLRQYAKQNPNLRLYFNPGGTQIRIGIQGFIDLLPLISVATMKLDEAGNLLGIGNDYSSRSDFARACASGFLSRGTKVVILNDSGGGSYMGREGEVYHTNPFPKEPIEDILRRGKHRIVQNFSGCGDGIFSGMLYCSEAYTDMNPEERLTFANSVTRLISLIPESHLRGMDEGIIGNIAGLSGDYVDMVKMTDSY